MKTGCTFRLDDITPGMHNENFNRIKAIFEKNNIYPLIGVVPDNKDDHLNLEPVDEKKEEDFWKEVCALQERGWMVAQHGYCHVYETEDGGLLQANPFSEFAGLPYEIQFAKLKKGKYLLQQHGIKTNIFMAPGHTFDECTLKALKDNQFEYITDGYWNAPYERKGLTFIPCTLSGPGNFTGIDTVCIHLNNYEEADFERLENFIQENRESLYSFSEMINTVPVVPYSEGIERAERKFIADKERKNKLAKNDKMQWYLQKTYHSNKWLKMIKRIICLPMLLFKK